MVQWRTFSIGSVRQAVEMAPKKSRRSAILKEEGQAMEESLRRQGLLSSASIPPAFSCFNDDRALKLPTFARLSQLSLYKSVHRHKTRSRATTEKFTANVASKKLAGRKPSVAILIPISAMASSSPPGWLQDPVGVCIQRRRLTTPTNQ